LALCAALEILAPVMSDHVVRKNQANLIPPASTTTGTRMNEKRSATKRQGSRRTASALKRSAVRSEG
jgi:hypothetical protein